MRLSILVALGTTLGFAMIDHWVIHSSNAVPDLVRFGLQVPAILLCLLATIKPLYLRVYLPAIQVAAPLFGMGSVMMACTRNRNTHRWWALDCCSSHSSCISCSACASRRRCAAT